MKLNEWINMHRGRSVALARQLGVAQPVVSDWVSGKKPIPAVHCRAIVAISNGEVTVQEMRPSDWVKYWPELATAQSHKAQPATNDVAEGV